MNGEIKIQFDPADVMEFVAHLTDGPEPSQEAAEAWMLEHYNRISDTLEAQFRDYIREHWQVTA